jgi:hypothetical protein
LSILFRREGTPSRASASSCFTQLLELKAFSVGPIFQPSQNISIIVWRYLLSSSEIYISDSSSISQHISSNYKVGQKYHNFNLQGNYKKFKLWVTEKLLVIKLSIKDKSNGYLDNFKDIYGKINQLRYLQKCYGSLIMTLDLSINPDPGKEYIKIIYMNVKCC